MKVIEIQLVKCKSKIWQFKNSEAVQFVIEKDIVVIGIFNGHVVFAWNASGAIDNLGINKTLEENIKRQLSVTAFKFKKGKARRKNGSGA